VHYLIMSFLCVSFALWWFFARNTSYGWVLQNIMGFAIIIYMQCNMRFPNMKVSAVMLLLLFVYDVFWVFASEYFFTSSVMMTVASGGRSGEAVPMMLRVPSSLQAVGPGASYSAIGFGDVVFPGLLVSFTHRFDLHKGFSGLKSYFNLAALGYTLGFIAAEVALITTRHGQPALLYLVPSTLGVTVLVAWRAGHLKEMWTGNSPALYQVVQLNSPSPPPEDDDGTVRLQVNAEDADIYFSSRTWPG
jgi:signal peptide peptidase-like protein 2B